MSGIKMDVKMNLKGLEDLRNQLQGTYTTRVGVLGSAAKRQNNEGSPLNNAEIGAIQMFGTADGKIPPRDFLLMPIQRNARKILQTLGVTKVRDAVERGDIKLVYKLLGAAAEGFVQKAFETAGFGQWAPNAPSTIARKGSSAPLIDTGQLRRAISSDVVKATGGKK